MKSNYLMFKIIRSIREEINSPSRVSHPNIVFVTWFLYITACLSKKKTLWIGVLTYYKMSPTVMRKMRMTTLIASINVIQLNPGSALNVTSASSLFSLKHSSSATSWILCMNVRINYCATNLTAEPEMFPFIFLSNYFTIFEYNKIYDKFLKSK